MGLLDRNFSFSSGERVVALSYDAIPPSGCRESRQRRSAFSTPNLKRTKARTPVTVPRASSFRACLSVRR
jgi:hypothetical protein